MQKKLLFVIRSLSGGGAERVISNLANHFSTMGYKVTLVCLDEGEIKYALAPEVNLESLVKRGSQNNIFYRGYYALLTFYRLFDLIRRMQPLCCISFMTSVNIWTGLCCLLLNKNYIVSERTSPYYSLEKLNSFTKFMAFRIYSKAKAVVLPSKKMIETFKSLRHFKNLKNLVAIYNPVHFFNAFNAGGEPLNPFILSVGRLDYDKGFDLLIDAFASIKNQNVDLLISGTGPNEEILEKRAADLGLQSRVKFIGFQKNLQDYYSKATVFVLASRVEGYPNALVEAMSMGAAVISTECDFGPTEIIQHGINGLLVPVDDTETLKNALNELLGDEQLRIALSINAQRINETNSIDNIAEKWNNLILS